MSRVLWVIAVFIVSVTMALTPTIGFAQQEHGGKEHGGAAPAVPAPAAGGQEHGGQTQAAVPAAPATPEATTPAPPVATPPALKPITITFTGELASLDTKGPMAMVTVKDRYGVTKEISCPGDCKITMGGMSKTLADLKVGDKATVEYTYDVATGKRTAQSITLGEAAAAPTP